MATASDVISKCLCFRTRQLGRSISRLYNQELRRVAMKVTQFDALVVLKHFGTSSTRHLSGILEVDRTTLLRNMDLLRRRGWVRLDKNHATRFALTARGTAALRRALPHWERAQAMTERRVGDSRVSRLRRLLDGAISAMRKP